MSQASSRKVTLKTWRTTDRCPFEIPFYKIYVSIIHDRVANKMHEHITNTQYGVRKQNEAPHMLSTLHAEYKMWVNKAEKTLYWCYWTGKSRLTKLTKAEWWKHWEGETYQGKT